MMRVSQCVMLLVFCGVFLMGSASAGIQSASDVLNECVRLTKALLTSITRFKLISLGASGSQTPTTIFRRVTSGSRFSLDVGSNTFVIQVNQGSLWGADAGESSASIGPNEVQQLEPDPGRIRTFRGTYTRNSLGGYSNSLAALYIQGDDTTSDRPGFISGFLLQNKDDGPKLEWIFIEPVRPLLKPFVHPYNIFSDPTLQELNTKCPLTENYHIVYKSDDTNFSIPLVPNNVQEMANQQQFNGEGDLSGTNIPLVAIGDTAYYDLYANVIEEKTWWEGQEELITLANAFYDTKFENLKLEIRTLKLQKDSGTLGASVRTDAYSQLCNFSQGVPGAHVEHPRTPGLSSSSPDPSEPMLVHLFTGLDLSPMPSGSAVADSGGGFCATGCGGFTDIVGIAEGTGGTKFESSSPPISSPFKKGCDIPFDKLDTKLGSEATPFPSARHALSQQAPDLTPKPVSFLCAIFPCKSRPGYQATLFQRFLLMTHEVGHNLGANHFDKNKTNIMNSTLSNKMRFRINSRSDHEIRDCLNVNSGGYCESQ